MQQNLAVRPDAGGSIGPPIRLRTNLFLIDIEDKVNASKRQLWMKYQVLILLVSKNPSKPSTLPLKKELRRVWNAFQKNETAGMSNYLEGRIPAFNGRDAAYFAKPLTQEVLEANVKLDNLPGSPVFKISIYNRIDLDVGELRKFVTGQPANQSDSNDVLAALNSMIRHALAEIYPTSRNNYYLDSKAKDWVGSGRVSVRPESLGGGIELWRGFFQQATLSTLSVRPVASPNPTPSFKLALNLDTTTGAFVKTGNMMDVVSSFIERNDRESLRSDRISNITRLKFNRLIKSCEISVNLRHRDGNVALDKRFRIKVGITSQSAVMSRFKDKEGVSWSVEQWFQTHYQVRLNFPDLPCVEVKPGVMYPIEFCSILPGNKYNRRLTAAQQMCATKFQTLGPSDRLAAVTNVYRSTLQLPRMQTFAKEFSLNFFPHENKIEFGNKVTGRILSPPQISYRDNRIQVPRKGVWQMESKDRFTRGATLSSFAIVVESNKDRDALCKNGVLERFFATARNTRGMNVGSPRRIEDVILVHQRGATVGSTFSSAVEQAGRTFGARPTMIFWVFNSNPSQDYSSFKAFGAEVGVQTQSILSKNLFKLETVQFSINLAMKINAKLGGLNFELAPGSPAGTGISWLDQNDSIIFGADLSHTQDKPSIVAVVASMDQTRMSYAEELRVQGLVEPGREGGRARKSEVIEDIKDMVKALLERYLRANGERLHKSRSCPPESILFYRDGVSDSEWDALFTKEIVAIETAIEETRCSVVNQYAAWRPKLTLIVVVKGHHVRFFGQDAHQFIDPKSKCVFFPSQEGGQGNIPAGTVVDTRVVDPRAFDWYGAAHTGILGTTRPARYVVLHDQHFPRLSSNDLQTATNALCHAFQRCNRAVSIPAPVYYADVICSRVADWINAAIDTLESSHGSEGDIASRAEDLAQYRAVLSEKDDGRRRMGNMWWL